MLRILSAMSFLAMAGGIIGLILRHALFFPLLWLIALQTAAVFLMFWARATFGMGSFHFTANPIEDHLVTTGPYRWIRHPIYTAVILFTLPPVLINHTSSSLAFGALILIGAVIRMLCEEHLLIQRFPEYREYASKTRRVIPWLI